MNIPSAALFSGIKVRYIVDLTSRSDFTCKFAKHSPVIETLSDKSARRERIRHPNVDRRRGFRHDLLW